MPKDIDLWPRLAVYWYYRYRENLEPCCDSDLKDIQKSRKIVADMERQFKLEKIDPDRKVKARGM